jgi:hypothetical protein
VGNRSLSARSQAHLFVASGASREILRIAPDGGVSHHGFIPDPSGACAG